ncbi:hypothetical protein SELMODRAFT_430523 [Selaginella moellendorffii]|uniref:Uncharacterized protein n=1 Tax=Selaginella moellendorffii TaxID=88036 RepID=D8T9N8_SELML|nr:hypothetical protein SELMODRAFT_430523 [Selaginella moellendorffii]
MDKIHEELEQEQQDATTKDGTVDWFGKSAAKGSTGGCAYWGKYRTNLIFLTIYLLGMVVLTLTITSLKPSPCKMNVSTCSVSTLEQKALLYLGLYTVAVGYGGYQLCISSFGGNQFDKEDPLEQKQLIVYVEDSVSWSCGFTISTAAAAASIIIFLIGTRLHRHKKTGGNPLTRVVKVFIAAALKLYVEVPSDSSQLYEVDSAVSAIQGSRKI